MYQYRYLTELNFSSLYDHNNIYASPIQEILPATTTQIAETFTSPAGYDKKWMLKHHYAIPDRCFSHNESPAVHLFHLKNCVLTEPYFDLAVNDGLVWEAFHSSYAHKKYLFDSHSQSYKHILASSSINVLEPGPFFLAPTRWYNTNYYHWILDCLPKLLVYKELKSINPDLRLLIHRFPSNSFQSQWLKILEIKDTDITYLREGLNHNIFNVYYVPILGANFLSRLSSLYFKVEINKYFNKVTHSSFPSQEKIYIPRKAGQARSIINEIEISSLLRSHGFHVCYPEDLSVIDQFKLFSDAKYIIGIHGSGLSNLLFAHPNASVLEITPPCINPGIFDLASSLELRYGYITSTYAKAAIEKQLIIVNALSLKDQVVSLLSN